MEGGVAAADLQALKEEILAGVAEQIEAAKTEIIAGALALPARSIAASGIGCSRPRHPCVAIKAEIGKMGGLEFEA